VDTDTLEEEKQRGISINLGFASYTDPQGTRFGFIDVPGHEKFVHTMLAGVSGIDAVLLVVASDEGVMPQTREHLHICHLLGVQDGLVVLTRCDLVEDPDLIELCQEEVKDLVQDTFLKNAPILPISAVSGLGMDQLRQELATLYSRLTPRHSEDPFRLSIDRSFSVKGFGTVITGTVIAGSLCKDAEVWRYPQEAPARIREMQVHGAPVQAIRIGQRAAINLSNLSKDAIQRGDQLAGPHSLLNSYMLDVELRLLDNAPQAIHHKDRVRVALGTQEIMGRVILFHDHALDAGNTALAQLRLESPASTRYGDRFIIRNFSPLFTLGGGRVLDPTPSKSRRIQGERQTRLKHLQGENEEARCEEVIYLQSVKGVSKQEVPLRTGLSKKQTVKVIQRLQSLQKIMCVDPVEQRYLHMDHIQRLGDFLCRVVQSFHQTYPERSGMTQAEFQSKLSLLFKNDRSVEHLLRYLVKQNRLAQQDQTFHLPSHQSHRTTDHERIIQQCLQLIHQGGLQPPPLNQSFAGTGSR